jgi:NADPH:quinone reductase-like Zn-dependent oxidoreductase
LGELARLVDAGRIRAIVEVILPLSQARRAQEASQMGHIRGKLVLKVAPSEPEALEAAVERELARL